MQPLGGYADWQITQMLSNAMGYPMNYSHASEIMDEIARLTPTFAGVSFEAIDAHGSIQWPCNARAPGRHAHHARRRIRARQGPVHRDGVRADQREGNARFPLILTTGRVLASTTSARRPAAPTTIYGTRRTGSRSIRTMPTSAA